MNLKLQPISSPMFALEFFSRAIRTQLVVKPVRTPGILHSSSRNYVSRHRIVLRLCAGRYYPLIEYLQDEIRAPQLITAPFLDPCARPGFEGLLDRQCPLMCRYVAIYPISIEDSQTYPTNMSPTLAIHMITSARFFDPNGTTGTSFVSVCAG
jgi:hypothetical protein